MITMRDLDLEYIENTNDYDVLRTQIYQHYGATDILGTSTKQVVMAFNFPPPLKFTDDTCYHCQLHPQLSDAERFFKHMLHPEARALLPFVDAILATEHKNNPIFAASTNLDIDRETLAQLVSKAHRLAISHGAAPCQKTRSMINTLILIELLVWHT